MVRKAVMSVGLNPTFKTTEESVVRLFAFVSLLFTCCCLVDCVVHADALIVLFIVSSGCVSLV